MPGHPQIAQCKQRVQVRRVLCKPPVSELDMPELPFDDPKRVLHLGTHARFERLDLVRQGISEQVHQIYPAALLIAGDKSYGTDQFQRC
jgi:hypothetical protein